MFSGFGVGFSICFRRNLFYGVHWACILLCFFVFVGCARLQDGRTTADDAASGTGFGKSVCRAGRFELTRYIKNAPGKVLTVYMEGDGRAFRSRSRPSSDPTPVNPVGLKLAIADPSEKVMYLARPCQYASSEELAACPSVFWTVARFSDPVVVSMNAALDRAKSETGAEKLRLIGFSGGGVLAALLASERDDVVSLVTVAAPLDHALWTRLHGVTPLSASLDPMERSAELSDVPQLHFAGGDDSVVPVEVVRSYMSALGNPPTAELIVIPDFDHTCCWARSWSGLVKRYFPRLRDRERIHVP